MGYEHGSLTPADQSLHGTGKGIEAAREEEDAIGRKAQWRVAGAARICRLAEVEISGKRDRLCWRRVEVEAVGVLGQEGQHRDERIADVAPVPEIEVPHRQREA